MIAHFEVLARRLRRWLSPSEWLVHLLRLEKSRATASEPGLLMIQIDGLSREQMENALESGHLPFLKHLIDRQRYELHSFYAGLPSSTPSVQAEIFYGVKSAVPAFSFFDRVAGRVFTMYEQEDATEIELRLRERGKPLLEGGSSYSNVYEGGAGEVHFCVPDLGVGNSLKRFSVYGFAAFLLCNLYGLLRTGVLLVVELFLAIIDAVRGLIAGQDLWKELKFVPFRVGICILLREMVTGGVKLDVIRGRPIIHLNLLGYDEQSHRRGPSSRFARWGLKGIDDAIERMWKAAHRSTCRDYDVWIYSDHGQETTLPYPKVTGHTIEQTVTAILNGAEPKKPTKETHRRGVQFRRAALLGNWIKRKIWRHTETPPHHGIHEPPEGKTRVVAMGPLGLVYPGHELPQQERDNLARKLVSYGRVPLVMAPEGAGKVLAWTKHGRFVLPEQCERILGRDHPFLEEVSQDLVDLCHHPNAGELLVSGWQVDGPRLSFPVESGAHAGPGSTETRGFALLPTDAPVETNGKGYMRPIDLRHAAMRLLGRLPEAEAPLVSVSPVVAEDVLRIMTYNVHSCVGMDGKTSPRRIARIIARYAPDVVALQEVDVGRERTSGHDQALRIARYLRMDHYFHPAIQVEEEKYGDAILSRFPLEVVRAGSLPLLEDRPDLEPRGALWCRIEVEGIPLDIVNTHLGLRRREQIAQAQALASEEWLRGDDRNGSLVLCGDMNALPGSPVYKTFRRILRDAQTELDDHRPQKTWFGRYPLGRIDHIFLSSDLEVMNAQVVNTHLARVASDHLPLIIEVRLPKRHPSLPYGAEEDEDAARAARETGAYDGD